MLREHLETENLERGYRGTAKTIRKMHLLVAKGKLDPTLHRLATWIRLTVPQDVRGSTRETAAAVFEWVRRHGIFQRDPFQVERIEHPISSTQPVVKARLAGKYRGPGLFVGDCDLYAIWVATLGGLLGFHYAFETSKSDPRRPDEFSHVWTALLVGNEWVPLDASTRGAYPGWRPPVPQDLIKQWLEEPIEKTMSGLNGHRANGMGWSEYVPIDYFRYDADRGQDWHAPALKDADPGRMDLLVPDEPVNTSAELEPGTELFQKESLPPADWRPSYTEGDEVFNTGPRYSETRKDRISLTKRFYPAESKFNRYVVSDVDRSKVKPGTVYHISPSTVPARDVDIVGGDLIAVKREGGRTVMKRENGQTIVMRPRRIPAGMGQFTSGITAGMTAAQQAAAATTTSGSIWDTIASTIKSAIPSASEALIARTQARYAEKLAAATNRVAGQQAVTPQAFTAPTPWYAKPWVLVGGALALGGVAYVALKPSPRRYRRRGR